MIVERPIASLLAVEIYSFANFVVVNCVPVAVIGERRRSRYWGLGCMGESQLRLATMHFGESYHQETRIARSEAQPFGKAGDGPKEYGSPAVTV